MNFTLIPIISQTYSLHFLISHYSLSITYPGNAHIGDYPIYIGEFYQFNLSSCIRQQNSLTAQFVSFSLSNLANIFYPPPNFYNN